MISTPSAAGQAGRRPVPSPNWLTWGAQVQEPIPLSEIKDVALG
jgi:hypothetical protein